jgi:nicotinamide-nucleotide adenylyltransferase
MIHSAVRSSSSTTKPRVLLLLAVQNADKAPSPASFPTRLAMMESFGHGIMEKADIDGVDIGVTTKPYFPDKASAIEETYPGMGQVFLVGYDTLIRVFDAKYYPEGKMDSVVRPFLAKTSLRVTLRTDGKWGGKEEQEAFWQRLEAWQRKEVELVDGVGGAVSSSRVRDKVCRGEDVRELIDEGVQWWINETNLYIEDGGA